MWDAGNQPGRSKNHEDQFISSTIAAVRKQSETGSSRRCVSVVLQRTVCTARQTEVEFVAMESSRENTGNEQFVHEMWEFHSQKDRGKRRFWKMRRGNGKKEYKVSDNKNPHTDRFWSKSEERYEMLRPNHTEKLHRNKARQRIRENITMDSRKYAKCVRKWRKKKLGGRLDNMQEKLRKNTYGLLEGERCASRWKGRSHFVVYLPALQQFHRGELHQSDSNKKKKHCS